MFVFVCFRVAGGTSVFFPFLLWATRCLLYVISDCMLINNRHQWETTTENSNTLSPAGRRQRTRHGEGRWQIHFYICLFRIRICYRRRTTMNIYFVFESEGVLKNTSVFTAFLLVLLSPAPDEPIHRPKSSFSRSPNLAGRKVWIPGCWPAGCWRTRENPALFCLASGGGGLGAWSYFIIGLSAQALRTSTPRPSCCTSRASTRFLLIVPPKIFCWTILFILVRFT